MSSVAAPLVAAPLVAAPLVAAPLSSQGSTLAWACAPSEGQGLAFELSTASTGWVERSLNINTWISKG